MTKRALLEKIYDSLYKEVSDILERFNPCEHKVCSSCHTCLGKLDFSAVKGSYGDNTTKEACCVGCKFWKNGCTADKPLYCKVWLCETAASKYPIVKSKLDIIQNKARKFNFVSGFLCRKEKVDAIDFCIEMNNFSRKQIDELVLSNGIDIA